MYDLVSQIIGSGATPDVINFTCSALVVLLTVMFVDGIFNIIRCFIRG